MSLTPSHSKLVGDCVKEPTSLFDKSRDVVPGVWSGISIHSLHMPWVGWPVGNNEINNGLIAAARGAFYMLTSDRDHVVKIQCP